MQRLYRIAQLHDRPTGELGIDFRPIEPTQLWSHNQPPSEQVLHSIATKAFITPKEASGDNPSRLLVQRERIIPALGWHTIREINPDILFENPALPDFK